MSRSSLNKYMNALRHTCPLSIYELVLLIIIAMNPYRPTHIIYYILYNITYYSENRYIGALTIIISVLIRRKLAPFIYLTTPINIGKMMNR